MSKGTVYTGIIYLPGHPKADLHGLLRCVVRTDRGMSHLTSILRTYDIPFSPVLFNWGVWCESKSFAELNATENQYGRALVCPTWCQYLGPEHYLPIPETLKAGAPKVAKKDEPLPAIGRHLFSPGENDPKRCRVCHLAKDENQKHVVPLMEMEKQS